MKRFFFNNLIVKLGNDFIPNAEGTNVFDGGIEILVILSFFCFLILQVSVYNNLLPSFQGLHKVNFTKIILGNFITSTDGTISFPRLFQFLTALAQTEDQVLVQRVRQSRRREKLREEKKRKRPKTKKK